jgi:hypothetical protein
MICPVVDYPRPENTYYHKKYGIRTSDLVINFKNESIFWTLFIFINAELGNLGIEGLKDKINLLK